MKIAPLSSFLWALLKSRFSGKAGNASGPATTTTYQSSLRPLLSSTPATTTSTTTSTPRHARIKQDCQQDCVDSFKFCAEEVDDICNDRFFISACQVECLDVHGSTTSVEDIDNCVEGCECGDDSSCVDQQKICHAIEDEKCMIARDECTRDCLLGIPS